MQDSKLLPSGKSDCKAEQYAAAGQVCAARHAPVGLCACCAAAPRRLGGCPTRPRRGPPWRAFAGRTLGPPPPQTHTHRPKAALQDSLVRPIDVGSPTG